jgi:hypothetical protein
MPWKRNSITRAISPGSGGGACWWLSVSLNRLPFLRIYAMARINGQK